MHFRITLSKVTVLTRSKFTYIHLNESNLRFNSDSRMLPFMLKVQGDLLNSSYQSYESLLLRVKHKLELRGRLNFNLLLLQFAHMTVPLSPNPILCRPPPERNGMDDLESLNSFVWITRQTK